MKFMLALNVISIEEVEVGQVVSKIAPPRVLVCKAHRYFEHCET